MSTYQLGESDGETRRLTAQAHEDPVAGRARWGGLQAGMTAVDAGCGPGVVARELARLCGPAGRVVAFDSSPARLAAARTGPAPAADGAPVEFREGDVLAPPVEPGTADFVFCQFVFEYLRRQADAMAALVRLLRPGGRLLVTDADDIGVHLAPVDDALRQDIRRMREALAATGFDADAGGRLYGLALDAGLTQVEVRLDARTYAGRAADEELEAWRQRFQALAPVAAAALGGAESYRRFGDRYLAALLDERVLKYTVIVSVRGIRP
jgi:SAM-dependent methyltransferase